MDVYILSVAPLSLFIRVMNSTAAVLVNVPGGTQRILNSNKLKAGDISAILLTSSCPYFSEGLSGLLQTLCNNGPPVNADLLIGNHNALGLLGVLNDFAHTAYWGGSPVLFSKTYKDHSISPYVIHATFSDSNTLLLFSIEYTVTKRKLDKRKIRELKLAGLQCKELAAGNTVVHNGIPISPDDVSELVTTHSVVILIDTHYPGQEEQVLLAVLDQLKKGGSCLVCASERYRNMLSVGEIQRPGVSIVYCTDSFALKSPNDPGVFTAYADFINLRRIWNKLVPRALIPPFEQCLASETPGMTRFFLGSTLERFAPTHLSTLLAPISNLEIYPQYSAMLKDTVSDSTTLPYTPNIDTPGLLLLGTGASVPSKYRNVSGYLFITSTRNTVCIDPGEGTLQLLEWVTKGDASELVAGLCFIGITHSHADHYLGLASLVQRYLIEIMHLKNKDRAKRQHPLIILAGTTELSYLNHNLKILGEPYEQLANSYLHILHREDASYLGKLFSLHELLNGHQFSSCNLTATHNIQLLFLQSDHIPNSISIFLKDDTLQAGIGISGDTRPSPFLISGSHILRHTDVKFLLVVHEATFSDSEQDLAVVKGHSTISQAADQLRKCGPDVGVFTHFSQRYTKSVPELLSDKKQEDQGALADRPIYLYASDLLWLPIERQLDHDSVCSLPASIQSWADLALSIKQLYSMVDGASVN